MTGEPDFVHTLPSGAQPTADTGVGPHPAELDDLVEQMCEMERARAQAGVSSRDYVIYS